jgi:hypothetical protein
LAAKPLTRPSLARTAPSLARTAPSLARAAPSLARAVLKPLSSDLATDLLPPARKARSAGCEVKVKVEVKK